MNWMVLFPTLLVMAFLLWRRVGMLTWMMVWWLASYVNLRYGFATPIPHSVIAIYMGILTFVLLLYATSDKKRWKQVRDPLVTFMTQRRYTLPLALVVLLLPGLVAANVYLRMTSPVSAPFFARTVHPATPDSITTLDKEFNLVTLQNPLRELEQTDPEAFRQHVQSGRKVYYKNCFYCHGDNTRGNGPFAHGLNPVPTNLPENIPLLQESFLFWRISKGGPGLPDEGGPWDTAMPAWEKFLSEQEIWEVILFLYDFAEVRPRAREEAHQ